MQGISAFDYAQNRGLYFCRSVFEVYLRDKRSNSFENVLQTTRSLNTNNSFKQNGFDLTPTPPVNGHAKFVRHNNRRSYVESQSQVTRSSPILSVEQISRVTNYPNSLSNLSNRQEQIDGDDNENENDNDDEDEDENRQRHRTSSVGTNSTLTGPPIKPRKSSTMSSKQQKSQHRRHHVVITTAHSDDDDEQNSLEGHGGQSDFEDDDDNHSSKSDRPNSRLALRHHDDRIQQQQAQQSTVNLRRPPLKHARQSNRHSMYDDYRFLDEQQQQQQQQQQSSQFPKSKSAHRSSASKEFPSPSSNRLGSGSGNQSATNRLKSGSKSISNDSIPALDLTVAGQKVFRTKQPLDSYLSNSLPTANAMRPPSGRLKPISSAKSTSSFNDEISSSSSKTLEDVTNNVKQISSSTLPSRTHLYKKKLAPLNNSNDLLLNKKVTHYSSMDQQAYLVDDVPSDRSEETSGGTSTGGAGGGERDMRTSSGTDKRSKYH